MGKPFTVGEFRALISDLPDDAPIIVGHEAPCEVRRVKVKEVPKDWPGAEQEYRFFDGDSAPDDAIDGIKLGAWSGNG